MNSEIMTFVYKAGFIRRGWDWKAVHFNGNIVATSGNQKYSNKEECLAMAQKYSPNGSSIRIME
jgi:hypothetical protein